MNSNQGPLSGSDVVGKVSPDKRNKYKKALQDGLDDLSPLEKAT
jgi:hypothetical protein